jgi:hypothetical protein
MKSGVSRQIGGYFSRLRDSDDALYHFGLGAGVPKGRPKGSQGKFPMKRPTYLRSGSLSSCATIAGVGERQQYPPRKRILLALISYVVAVSLAYFAARAPAAIYLAVFLGVFILIWIIVNPAHRGSKPTHYRIFPSDQ